MRIVLMLSLLVAVAACSGVTKENLGLSRKSPNEKMVEQREPLSLPPEFDVRPDVK